LTPSLIPPRHPPYFIPLYLLHLHHLFTILSPSSLSFSLYSFLPVLFLIPVSCAFQHLTILSCSHFKTKYVLTHTHFSPIHILIFPPY
jgi:predicted ferric reductase